jgi:hypothetical protein
MLNNTLHLNNFSNAKYTLFAHCNLRTSAAKTHRFAILDCRISMELSLPSKYNKLIQQAQVMRSLVLCSERLSKIHPRYK